LLSSTCLAQWLDWYQPPKKRRKKGIDYPSHTITGHHLIISIPISQSPINIQIHPPQNNIHCGSASEPGASGLPYYCCSTPGPTCVRSCCKWRASCVVSQQEQNQKKPFVCVLKACDLAAHLMPNVNTRLFAYMCMRLPAGPRSIAGLPFDSIGILRTTFVLRTTCMRSCCNWSASCVAAWPTKNQKHSMFACPNFD